MSQRKSKVKENKSVLFIHGGAGKIKHEKRHRSGIQKALQKGTACLLRENSALDAVEVAINEMEKQAVFNAGRGSVPSLTGEVEMDASIMSSSGESGAVAAIQNIKHPLSLARIVMEKTDHRLLVSAGAEKLASIHHCQRGEMLTTERRNLWKKSIEMVKQGKQVGSFEKIRQMLSDYFPGTVGAVARDCTGTIVAGTSTGGMFLHLPGRVGDSPILGAGTYASPSGGASITGHGESIMRSLVAYRLVKLMDSFSAQEAADTLLAELKTENSSCGFICVDSCGNIGFAYNTESMSYGYSIDGVMTLF